MLSLSPLSLSLLAAGAARARGRSLRARQLLRNDLLARARFIRRTRKIVVGMVWCVCVCMGVWMIVVEKSEEGTGKNG